MADETDVPPLEDMTEVIERIRHLNPTEDKARLAGGGSNSDILETQQTEDAANTNGTNRQKKTKEKKKDGFGGMNKGFLNKQPGKSKKTTADDIINLKPKEKPSDPLVLPEVQKAMDDDPAIQFQNKDWVTEDLLKKVDSRPELLKKLLDPRYNQALSDFQRDPQAAVDKYKNNADLQSFFKEFMGILGDHFSNYNSKTSADGGTRQASNSKMEELPPVDHEVQKVLSDPIVKETLLDPDIQRLLNTLRTDPDTGQQMVKTANRELKEKLDILIKAGLLQMEKQQT